jgi:hypothetical protein
LPLHIYFPTLGPVILIPITLDRQTRVVLALDDQVNSIVTNGYLRPNAVPALGKLVKNINLERRVTELPRASSLILIVCKWRTEMLDKRPAETVGFTKLMRFN